MSKPRQSVDDQSRSEPMPELAVQLTPPEELEARKNPSGPLEGAIRLDESHLPVPKDIIESKSERWLGIESVVLIIAGLMLVFIALIAWQISLMPGPGKP